VIRLRNEQPSFGDGLISAEVEDLWEPWMRHADKILSDPSLLSLTLNELEKRVKPGQKRGRPGTSAEVALRMLLLKHVRSFSFEELTREVRANLVYREFTRVGGGKTPDDKTMSRLARQLGPDCVKLLHERIVEISLKEKIVAGRKLRVDTTVVETNIHYPTDSSLLGDGVRVATRVMKKIQNLAAKTGAAFRDRSKSVKLRVLDIARSTRSRGAQAQEKMKEGYVKLLDSTGRVLGQAERFVREIEQGVKHASGTGQEKLERLGLELKSVVARVGQVVRQTRARVLDGNTHAEGKLLSIFETGTEAIRKGKAAKPTEFGKMVKIQEAENQIIVDYEVYAKRPNDSDLLIPSIEIHEKLLKRTPHLVAADAGFYSGKNEKEAKAKGVKRVSVPNRSTKNLEKRKEQKKRWFREGQKWRTGCEGRISVLKRRHGLTRSRYNGDAGMERWVGLGVIADNLINIGTQLSIKERSKKQKTAEKDQKAG
jgi:IS5 family transposase